MGLIGELKSLLGLSPFAPCFVLPSGHMVLGVQAIMLEHEAEDTKFNVVERLGWQERKLDLAKLGQELQPRLVENRGRRKSSSTT